MPAPPTPKTPPAKGSLGKWLAGHKWEAGLGAGGIGITVYLAVRARKNAAAGGTSTSGTSASQALPVSYYPGTSGGDSYNATEMDAILSQLSSELSTAGQPSNPNSSLTLQPGQVGAGGGFTDPSLNPLSDSSGANYVPFASAQAAWAYLNAGGTGYVESAPGQFNPVTAGDVPPGGTWVYQKVGTSGK